MSDLLPFEQQFWIKSPVLHGAYRVNSWGAWARLVDLACRHWPAATGHKVIEMLGEAGHWGVAAQDNLPRFEHDYFAAGTKLCDWYPGGVCGLVELFLAGSSVYVDPLAVLNLSFLERFSKKTAVTAVVEAPLVPNTMKDALIGLVDQWLESNLGVPTDYPEPQPSIVLPKGVNVTFPKVKVDADQAELAIVATQEPGAGTKLDLEGLKAKLHELAKARAPKVKVVAEKEPAEAKPKKKHNPFSNIL